MDFMDFMDFAVPIAEHGFIRTPLGPQVVNPFAPAV